MSLEMDSGMSLATSSLRSVVLASRVMMSTIFLRMARICELCAYAVRLIWPGRLVVKPMANMRSV